MIDLHDVISKYIPFDSRPSSKGWHAILCKVCNDRGHKGKRGAFKFEDSGCSYHCFNCGKTGHFDVTQTHAMSKDFQLIMHDFGVPSDEIQRLKLLTLQNKDSSGSTSKFKTSNNDTDFVTDPTTIELPSHFYKLNDASCDESVDPWAVIARDYLHNRCIDYAKYDFYLSTGESNKPDEKFTAKKWKYRIIYPIYDRHNRVIFYQGRALIDLTKKYESASVSKTKVIYGFDQLYNHSDLPLYIMEGFFDAFCINGCATLGNKLTIEQLEFFDRSRRQKVIVPDLTGRGYIMAEQAIEKGWAISIPDVTGCKDINDAICKYGKMYVLKTLHDNTCSGFLAKTKIKLFCS